MGNLREMQQKAAESLHRADAAIAAGNGQAHAEPDVSTSDIAADLTAPVHVAWSRVMHDVQWLGKNRKGDKYMYRGIDDVMNLVGPAFRKHGVMVIPTGIEPTFTVINTKSGASMNYCRATVQFTVYGPTGDSFQATVLGEGFDTGDKSGSKAQSIALRTLLINGLAIQTNEPARDTEYGTQYEIATPAPPTADEYYTEITREKITLERLRTIRREIEGKPVADETVTELDGGTIKLWDALIREGRKRQGGGA